MADRVVIPDMQTISAQYVISNGKLITMKRTIIERKRLAATSIMALAAFWGLAPLLLFTVFLFFGSLNFVKMELSEPMALTWNAMLSFLFFFQHSGLVRRRFRARQAKIIPPHYNDAFFSITSGIILTIVISVWQPSTTVLYELDGFPRQIARCVFILASAGFLWGVNTLKSFDAFGRTPIEAHLNGTRPELQEFAVCGPYRWVRHPLYFFTFLLIWSCPDLTADRLLFNILWTVWIYIGTVLEEKDLLSAFGNQYRNYQRNVPMLLPWKTPRSQ